VKSSPVGEGGAEEHRLEILDMDSRHRLVLCQF
jgi:hypothetical protein